MIIAFARTPTGKQIAGRDVHLRDATSAKVDFSSPIRSIGPRVQFDGALAWLRATMLRNVNPGVDMRAREGRLILTMLGGIYRLEREMMLKSRRDRIAMAKAE